MNHHQLIFQVLYSYRYIRPLTEILPTLDVIPSADDVPDSTDDDAGVSCSRRDGPPRHGGGRQLGPRHRGAVRVQYVDVAKAVGDGAA